LDVLINDDDCNLNIKLGTFANNIKKEIIGVIGSFISLLIRLDEKKTHNMLALMLDPIFKSLILISSSY
jgi:hypothetical protein